MKFKNFNLLNITDNSDIVSSNRELSEAIRDIAEINNSTKDRVDISLKEYLTLTEELKRCKAQIKEYEKLISSLPFSLNCFNLDEAYCLYQQYESFSSYDYGRIHLVLPIKESEFQEYRLSEFRQLVKNKILEYSKT